jgi:hypothetical protein
MSIFNGILRRIRTSPTVEGRADWIELLIAWMHAGYPRVLHVLNEGARTYVEEGYAIGTPGAPELANHGIVGLRYVDFTRRSVAQGKLVALKIMRDAIQVAPAGVGGELQLGIVTAGGVTISKGKQLRADLDTLDLWEEQCADLLPGGPDVPSASDTPDTGVRPPG